MKSWRFTSMLAIPLLIGAGAFWLRAQFSDTRPLASLLPAGAIWYVEAKDFKKLFEQWNSSAEKAKWTASDNFSVLARSRLLGRLGEAQDAYAALSGLPIQMSLAGEVVGRRSAFAIYDFSKLLFVYVTEQPESALDSSQLWRSRGSYSTRQVNGIPFYLKVEASGERTIAFTSYKNWFVLSTSQEEIAQTLELLSGRQAASIATEPWYAATASRQAAGDLRLVYNTNKLVSSPQFRTYWVQRNVSELKAFSAGISDLFEGKDGLEEKRLLLRKSDTPIADGGLTEVLRFASSNTSLYRAWSHPQAELLASVLQQIVFGEAVQMESLYHLAAPIVTAEAGVFGSESDLETRIDEPPFVRSSDASVDALVAAIQKMEPLALLHLQTTAQLQDQVFVMPASGAVIICKRPDLAALNSALAKSSSLLQTGSLDPLQVSVDNDAIVIARINVVRGAAPILVPDKTSYAAVYNRVADWPQYKKLFAVIDHGQATPAFFSGNLQSLGDSFSRLQSASIVSEERPDSVVESLRYNLSQP